MDVGSSANGANDTFDFGMNSVYLYGFAFLTDCLEQTFTGSSLAEME